MKKYISLLIMAVMLTLTACNSDEPNNESTSVMIMYNRAVNTENNTVTFSQSTCSFAIRQDASLTMQVKMILKLSEGNNVEFNSDFMPLTACEDENYTYTFAESGNINAGSHTISRFRGKINLTGPTFVQYEVDGKYQCFSTLQPYYSHATTSIISTESSGAVSYTANDISYGLIFNNAGNKGALYLFDFHATESGQKYPILLYDNLTLVPTSTGYHLFGSDVTATHYESTYDTAGTEVEQYHATSIDLVISQQGLGITGTINAGSEDTPTTITLNGRFFESFLDPILLWP